MARSRGVCRVEEGWLPDCVPFDGPFDLVCLLDVLEYLEDEQKALVRVRELLAPNGWLLLTVPAYPGLWSRHDVAVDHKRRYSDRSLERLLGRTGFASYYRTHFNLALLPLIAAIRLMHPPSSSNARRSDVWMPPLPLNHLLAFVLKAEAALVPRQSIPAGLSIVQVCRPG